MLFIAGTDSECGSTGKGVDEISGMPEVVETSERQVTADERKRENGSSLSDDRERKGVAILQACLSDWDLYS